MPAGPRLKSERVVYMDGAWDMFHAGSFVSVCQPLGGAHDLAICQAIHRSVCSMPDWLTCLRLLSVCLPACRSACLPVGLPACLSCLPACLPVGTVR